MAEISIPARPFPFVAPLAKTALLAIDLQHDFLLLGGFGDDRSSTHLGAVQAIIPTCQELLALFRVHSLPVVHTREGQVPDPTDLQSSEDQRAPGGYGKVIGGPGINESRLLVRGEYGHDIHEAMAPLLGEIVVDNPGKGAFWDSDLLEVLAGLGVTHLVVMGVTVERCVTTTVREANDRGFECCEFASIPIGSTQLMLTGVIEECTAGYNDCSKAPSLDMLHCSNRLFGYVCTLAEIKEAFNLLRPVAPAKSWDIRHKNSLNIETLTSAYRTGATTPTAVIFAIHAQISANPSMKEIFIHVITLPELVTRAQSLEIEYPNPISRPPLFGIPFSIKDSIDLAGVPTTTACPALAYTPTNSAAIVTRLESLGAIALGKTNLDQLATGLTGCRSPYGIPPCVFSRSHIPGGSSSGAAVSVGANLTSFAIATDTAGSGRVPAGFNGVVGFKPTKGTLSFRGVITACESLDCIALITRTVEDARKVWRLVRGFDADDRHAKHLPSPQNHVNAYPTSFRFATPPRDLLARVCSPPYLQLFTAAVERLRSTGGVEVLVDYTVFEDAGKLLYDGTFVSERLAGLPKGWLAENLDTLHPVIREIFKAVQKRGSTAEDVYRDLHTMMRYPPQSICSLHVLTDQPASDAKRKPSSLSAESTFS